MYSLVPFLSKYILRVPQILKSFKFCGTQKTRALNRTFELRRSALKNTPVCCDKFLPLISNMWEKVIHVQFNLGVLVISKESLKSTLTIGILCTLD